MPSTAQDNTIGSGGLGAAGGKSCVSGTENTNGGGLYRIRCGDCKGHWLNSWNSTGRCN